MNKLQFKIRVGITMGDPSGIGPEIISKTIPRIKGLAEFVIIGDSWALGQFIACNAHWPKGIEFIDLKNVKSKDFKFGKVRPEYARAAIEYLDKALGLIKNKQIHCLVTCPISKESINLAGFNYPGHTEYLMKHTGAKYTVMMLLNKELKFSLITRHIPLKDVASKLNNKELLRNILMTHSALKKIFLFPRPRLVVCGLNPHASDKGVIGNEETKIIGPVLKKLRGQIKSISGPISADIAIRGAKDKKYDCVIAMYHDQALIPLKLSGSDTGVNLTLGLPFIRTSPLHGTAFDIAGKNLASPKSLIEAIKLAVICTRNLKRA